MLGAISPSGGFTRHRLKLFFFLAAIAAWFIAVGNAPARRHTKASPAQENPAVLAEVYGEFNDQYFQGRLPKDTVVDWSESADNIASTYKMGDGRFHITFNPKYALAHRVYATTMLHEQCHIKTYDERDFETGWHGKRWRSCMLQLDMQGAFRRELIDFYVGD